MKLMLYIKINFFVIWFLNFVFFCGKCKFLFYGYVDESDGYFVNNLILYIFYVVIGFKFNLCRMFKII